MGEIGDAALAEARRWIGTPFRHRASRRGAGCDCLGLFRGVWRALYGGEPAETPPYGPGRRSAAETAALIGAAATLGRLTPVGDARAGDVLLLGVARRGAADHIGFRGEDEAGRPTLVHAWSGRIVTESPLGPALARRVVAVMRLPERSG